MIEASWGLGEAVVAGLVIPDNFRIDRSGRGARADAGAQADRDPHAARGRHLRGGGLAGARGAALPRRRRARPRSRLADALRGGLRPGRDIEWAFAGGSSTSCSAGRSRAPAESDLGSALFAGLPVRDTPGGSSEQAQPAAGAEQAGWHGGMALVVVIVRRTFSVTVPAPPPHVQRPQPPPPTQTAPVPAWPAPGLTSAGAG